jgi:hypothetical protein
LCTHLCTGQAETGQMQKSLDSFMPQVCRGQHGHQRQPGTSETGVAWLITQRSRVQIPPPLPRSEAPFRTGRGLSHVVCKRGSRSGRLARVPADRRALILARLIRDLGRPARRARAVPNRAASLM